jgi:hypothetical protein
MPTVFARLKADGLVYYGFAVVGGEQSELLQQIDITGPTACPPLPGESATPAEHEAWLTELKSKGFAVETRIIDNRSKPSH